jgi:hypothetical protein
MTHSRAVHCSRAGLQASFNNACFLIVEKTRSTRRNHICVMKVIWKWEQFSHVIMIIFFDSRDGFNAGVLKWVRQLWCITKSQGLCTASCRACPSYGNFRCKQPDTNVNLACNNHHCPNWRVQCEHNHNSKMFSLPLKRLFDAIRNISDLQPNCHTRFQVALALLVGWLSVIRLDLPL